MTTRIDLSLDAAAGVASRTPMIRGNLQLRLASGGWLQVQLDDCEEVSGRDAELVADLLVDLAAWVRGQR